MSLIKLDIPTLVSDTQVDGNPQYYFRPLFLPYPVATHVRYRNGLALFRKEVRQVFKGFSLNAQNAQQLLWFRFKPEVRYKQYPQGFMLGRQLIKGNVGVAYFQLSGHYFICLPAFNNFMFMASGSRGSKPKIEQEVSRVVKKLLHQYRQEEAEEFKPEAYFSGKREFVTQVETSINISETDFSFETEPDNWFFTSILSESSFVGIEELEKVGQDLNALYPSELERAFYQDEIVRQLYLSIFQSGNTPIAIVGPEGIGKHTVLHEAIWRHENGYYEEKQGNTQRVWHIDPTRIISGMSIVGMWQKRFEAIIDYIRRPDERSTASDKILFDNPVALLRIGKSAQNNLTLSGVLRPYLEKRQLQVILIASPEEWKIVQEQGRPFSRQFRVVRMQAPAIEKATRIILRKRKQLEQANGVVIQIQAVQQLLDIQRNYLRNKPLPGSVLKLMRQLAVKYRMQHVSAPEVRQEFKAISGLQQNIFDSAEAMDPVEIRKLIRQELVGQQDAVEALAGAIHLIKSKLADPERPLSSFLFIGPTGVGKTQAAKVLCKFLMGSEDFLMRFDMNEYIDAGAVQRLIGDYFNPEGLLTGAVRYRPFGILLLDEIEKAHPLVHDLLLQVLDDGRLTDSLGRTIDFTNIVIIMTSNVGAREAATKLGYQSGQPPSSAVYQRAVELTFRPEFINRIDRIVIFKSLEFRHILNIARLQINELLRRDGFVRRATILNISQDALEWVAHRGYDARMGGRALKRQIERDLTALSAEQLITTYTDTPILMNIVLQDGQLLPEINPLGFVSAVEKNWLPTLPDETQGRRFYRILLNLLENIRAQLQQFELRQENAREDMVYVDLEARANNNWQYYHYKARLEESKEAIQNIMLGFRDRYYKVGPSIPFRYRPVSLTPRRDWSTKGVRENFKDRLFQQEGIKEISEAYQYALVQFDSLKTEFVSNFLRAMVLKTQLKGVLSGKTEKWRLKIQSCITGMGENEVAFLIEKYSALLKLIDIYHDANTKDGSIEIEGYGVSQLLSGELGVHLFYTAHRNPLPVSVSLHENSQNPSYQVVRIYDSGITLTDLRTGFSNDINITPDELLLLVYAGIPAGLRNRINPFPAFPDAK
jgi:ATP-dependent Clp protease ATP-binding subunit ClpC